jgi:integrase
VKVYRHEELARFFAACSDLERVLFATFLLTGFREQEVMFLYWSDVNFELRTVRDRETGTGVLPEAMGRS